MRNVIEDSFVSFFEHSLLDPLFHLFCRVFFAVDFQAFKFAVGEALGHFRIVLEMDFSKVAFILI